MSKRIELEIPLQVFSYLSLQQTNYLEVIESFYLLEKFYFIEKSFELFIIQCILDYPNLGYPNLDYPNAKMIGGALDMMVVFQSSTRYVDSLKKTIFLKRDFMGHKWSINPNIGGIRNSFCLVSSL